MLGFLEPEPNQKNIPSSSSAIPLEMSPPAPKGSTSIAPGQLSLYNRKDKSLGLLCSKFVKLYDRDGVETIEIGDTATRLGVERRRIYDIVNVLERLGVLEKKAKNKYSWEGLKAIPPTLKELKEEGMRGNFTASNCCSLETVGLPEYGDFSNFKPQGQDEPSVSRAPPRKDNSMAHLTDNFLKLFICSGIDCITLDYAAKALLGDSYQSAALRTKVRRLYDIANVLSSMNLIEKTHLSESGKPAFRWLGLGRQFTNGTAGVCKSDQSKRLFGAEITNNVCKRTKVDDSSNGMKHLRPSIMLGSLDCDIHKQVDERNCPGSFEFGPFAPVGLQRTKNVIHVQDWENLASTYCPQYRNQALDDLFVHYLEACKSWYVQVDGKKQTESNDGKKQTESNDGKKQTESNDMRQPSRSCLSFR